LHLHISTCAKYATDRNCLLRDPRGQAFPLQLIFVGSLARLIFRTIFIKPEKAKRTTKIQNQDEKILEEMISRIISSHKDWKRLLIFFIFFSYLSYIILSFIF